MQERMTNEELIKKYKKLKEQNNTHEMNFVLEQLIEKNMRLINACIKKCVYNKKNISIADIEDLRAEGIEALWESIEAYEYEKGAGFITYAVWMIDSRIKDWLRKNNMIRIPNKVQSLCSKYYEVTKQYQQDNEGKDPPKEYIKKALGVNDKILGKIFDALKAYDIESLYNNKNEENCVNQITDYDDNIKEILIREADEEFEIILSNTRNEKEKRVIKGCYKENKKYKDLARELGVTEQRIYRIKKDALTHLKQNSIVKNIAVDNGYIDK